MEHLLESRSLISWMSFFGVDKDSFEAAAHNLTNKSVNFCFLSRKEMETYVMILTFMKISGHSFDPRLIGGSVFENFWNTRQISIDKKSLSSTYKLWGQALGDIFAVEVNTIGFLSHLYSEIFEVSAKALNDLKYRETVTEPILIDTCKLAKAFMPKFPETIDPVPLFETMLPFFFRGVFIGASRITNSHHFRFHKISNTQQFKDTQFEFLRYFRKFALDFLDYQRPGPNTGLLLALFTQIAAMGFRILLGPLLTSSFWKVSKEIIIELAVNIVTPLSKHRDIYSKYFFQSLDDPLTVIFELFNSEICKGENLLERQMFIHPLMQFLNHFLEKGIDEIDGSKRYLKKLMFIFDQNFPQVPILSNPSFVYKLPLAPACLIIRRSHRLGRSLRFSNTLDLKVGGPKGMVLGLVTNQVEVEELKKNLLVLEEYVAGIEVFELRTLIICLAEARRSGGKLRSGSVNAYSELTGLRILLVKIALFFDPRIESGKGLIRRGFEYISNGIGTMNWKLACVFFDFLPLFASIFRENCPLISKFLAACVIEFHEFLVKSRTGLSELPNTKIIQLFKLYHFLHGVKYSHNGVPDPKLYTCYCSSLSDPLSTGHYCPVCFRILNIEKVYFAKEIVINFSAELSNFHLEKGIQVSERIKDIPKQKISLVDIISDHDKLKSHLIDFLIEKVEGLYAPL